MAARRKVKRERVTLTAPTGTRVTVGAESVERFVARGYQADKPKKSAPRKAEPEQSETDSK